MAEAGVIVPLVLDRVQVPISGGEVVDPLRAPTLQLPRLGQAPEGAQPGGEVIECRQVGQLTAVAAEQDFAPLHQAVDGLFRRCDVARWRPLVSNSWVDVGS